MRTGEQEQDRSAALNALRKQALSDRLRTLMSERGLTVTATAKLVQERLADERFNPVNITHYRAGRSLPRPRVLRALSEVLGVAPEDLVPGAVKEGDHSPSLNVAGKSLRGRGKQGLRLPSERAIAATPAFHIEDMSGGEAWLQINQRLSWPTVIKILQVLKGEEQAVKPDEEES